MSGASSDRSDTLALLSDDRENAKERRRESVQENGGASQAE